LDLKEKQLEATQHQEEFFKELELSNDGFATIASYFRKSNIVA